MRHLFLLALIGCAQQPASIKLDQAGPVTVHTLDPVALPGATILDAKGNPLTTDVKVDWAVTPADLAKVDVAARQVVPSGEGRLKVTVTAGKATASYDIDVVIPDSLAISGAPVEGKVEVGADVTLTAQVLDGEEPIEDIAVGWMSSDRAVATVKDGVITGQSPGAVKITARGGGVESSVDLTVVDSAVADEDLAAKEPAGPAGSGLPAAPGHKQPGKK